MKVKDGRIKPMEIRWGKVVKEDQEPLLFIRFRDIDTYTAKQTPTISS